jgi:antigen flippase
VANDQKNRISYESILKSSSILGVIQVFIYLLGLIRVKILALALGPAGVGLWGYFQSVLSTSVVVSSLGVQSSGVRLLAEANSEGDSKKTGELYAVIVKSSSISAIAGLVIIVAIASPLSVWHLDSPDHKIDFYLVGFGALFTVISGAHMAVLQGLRRLTGYGFVSLGGAVLGTVITALCIYGLRENGIGLSLAASGLASLLVSYFGVTNLPIESSQLSVKRAATLYRSLASLGLAIMWSNLITSCAALLTRVFVVQEAGISSAGIYQAAWGLSGLFAGLVLNAMGTDYYPRLAAVAHQDVEASNLINRQTEVGLLLALPGLVGTLVFGGELLHIFYSESFRSGESMLPWFVVGVLGRVTSWPLGFLLMARGLAAWYAAIETIAMAFSLAATYFLIQNYGLDGVAIAFALLYVFYNVVMMLFVKKLIGFSWSTEVQRLLAVALSLIALCGAAGAFAPKTTLWVAGPMLLVIASYISARGIVARMSKENPLVVFLTKCGLGRALGIGLSR